MFLQFFRTHLNVLKHKVANMFAVVRACKYLLFPPPSEKDSWLPSFQTMCRAIKAVLGDRNEAPKTPNSEFYSPFPDSSPAPEREMGGWATCAMLQIFCTAMFAASV